MTPDEAAEVQRYLKKAFLDGVAIGEERAFAKSFDATKHPRDHAGRWSRVIAEYHAATGKAKLGLEAALANAGVIDPDNQDSAPDHGVHPRDVAKALTASWLQLHRSGHHDALPTLERALAHAGAEKIGEEGGEEPYTGNRHQADVGVLTGTPVRVVRPGWQMATASGTLRLVPAAVEPVGVSKALDPQPMSTLEGSAGGFLVGEGGGRKRRKKRLRRRVDAVCGGILKALAAPGASPPAGHEHEGIHTDKAGRKYRIEDGKRVPVGGSEPGAAGPSSPSPSPPSDVRPATAESFRAAGMKPEQAQAFLSQPDQIHAAASATGTSPTVVQAELEKVAAGDKAKPESPESQPAHPIPSPKVAHLHAPVVESKALGGGVNATSVVTLGNGAKGVWKPAAGEKRGYRPGQIPDGTNYRRESASHQIADAMGMGDLVPATTTRTIDGHEGSVQEFVPNASLALRTTNRFDGDEGRIKAAVFDYVTGQTDRHPGNWMLTEKPAKGLAEKIKKWVGAPREGEHLRLIDNGLSLPMVEMSGHLDNSDFLRKSSDDKVPDLSHLAGKWGDVERALKSNGIEPEAVEKAKARFDAVVNAGKAGKTFGELPYAGGTVNQHLYRGSTR